MSKYYKIKPGEYSNKKLINSNEEWYGKGWSVKESEDHKFYFEYISGALQGKLKIIEIKEEDFLLAKKEKLSFEEMCAKYKVS